VPVKNTYIDTVSVGKALQNMPLFLTPDGKWYIEVPLEQTYQAAYSSLPKHLRDIIDHTIST
jgi:hypothetical protein